MNKKIDIEKYEGYTEGKWIYCDATIYATNKRGGRFKDNDVIAEYPCWNYNKDQLITKEEEANLRLMTDAPLILQALKDERAEVKRLRERLDRAERYIIEPTLIRNYFADVVTKGLVDESDNLG